MIGGYSFRSQLIFLQLRTDPDIKYGKNIEKKKSELEILYALSWQLHVFSQEKKHYLKHCFEFINIYSGFIINQAPREESEIKDEHNYVAFF